MSLAEINLHKYFLNLGSHGGSCIDYRILVRDAMSSGGNLPTFGRNPMFSSSVYEWRIARHIFFGNVEHLYQTTRCQIPDNGNLHKEL